MEIKIESMTSVNFLHSLYDFGNNKYRIKTNKENDSFEGFHYFSPRTIGYDHENFLVAYNENRDIVGVLCYGNYRFDGQSVSYIDIKKQYKNKGVAKSLIKELNYYLLSDKPLKISRLSVEGKKCNIDVLFCKIIDTTKVIL